MTIKAVTVNNRKKVFVVETKAGEYTYPFAKADPAPSSTDRVADAEVDREIGREGFVYKLQSGKEGSVHVEQVLDYNRDPGYLTELTLYKLTLEAQDRLAKSGLSKREVIRRLGTSATQLYRLLDQTNYGKSIDQMLALLGVLDCDVEFIIRPRKTA